MNFSHSPVFLLKKNFGKEALQGPVFLLRLQTAGRAPPNRLFSFCSKMNHNDVLSRKLQLSRLFDCVTIFVIVLIKGILLNIHFCNGTTLETLENWIPWNVSSKILN